jgi:hypothetical protein
MSTAIAIQSDTVWLCIMDYAFSPLNSSLAARTPELKQALEAGVYAYPDITRKDFYDVKLPSGWAYVHVRDDNRTVYLIAYTRTLS